MQRDAISEEAIAPYPSAARGWFTVFVLVLGYLVALTDRQVLALLIEPIKAHLGVADFAMSLLVGFAFAIFYSLFGLPLGALADRYNRTRLIVVGMMVWSVATLLCGFAESFAALFLFRILVGAGEASFNPAAYSILADSFPPKRLARATAIVSFGAHVGAGLALVIGGIVIDHFTAHPDFLGLGAFEPWQSTFILVGLPGFVVAALVLTLKEPERRGRAGKAAASPFDAYRMLWRDRRDYYAIYGAGTGMGVVTYCGFSWFPAHIMRTFGASPTTTGSLLGVIQLVAALVGGIAIVVLIERFIRQGKADAHVRAVMVTSGLLIPTMIAPLMPTLALTAGVWFVSSVLQHSYYGSLIAGLQIVTPREARGANAALFLMTITLVGLAGGTALVGAVAQFGFPGDVRGAGYGIAIVGGAAAIFAHMSARLGLARYRTLAAPHLLSSDQ